MVKMPSGYILFRLLLLLKDLNRVSYASTVRIYPLYICYWVIRLIIAMYCTFPNEHSDPELLDL